MAELDMGNDKIMKICLALKNETLEPARQEAGEIVENAKLQREEILQKAKGEADRIIEQARALMDQKKKVLESALQLAARQSLEALRQAVEKQFFRENLAKLAAEALSGADVAARLINSIVEALDKEGVDASLGAYVAKNISPEEVNKLLLKEVIGRLAEKGVQVGGFASGVKLRMQNGMLTLDVSEEALKELLESFIRTEFRKLLFV